MVLVNVLVIVLLATTVLALMLTSGDAEIDRSIALRDAGQAQAIAHGGELSAVAALRRDLARGNTGVTLSDGWARIGDRNAAVEGGHFTLAVSDAQARFNLNRLARGDVASRATFGDIAVAAGLERGLADRIALLFATNGRVADLAPLMALAPQSDIAERLAPFCTLLPVDTDVNLNTAPEPLIAALFGSPVVARLIVGQRDREGGLNAAGLALNHILLPPGTGLSSAWFWVRDRVTIGGSTQGLTSLIHTGFAANAPQANVVARWRGRPPLQAPPLAE